LIPDKAIDHAAALLAEDSIILHISKPRRTKLGHFKRSPDQKYPEISINEDLGLERFLFTLVHEIAHWKAYRDYGRRIKPHGKEWKHTFKMMMLPVLLEEVFAPEILRVIKAHLHSPKASSCSDPVLQKSFDDLEGIEKLTLEGIAEGSVFKLSNGRVFLKGERKRTRYLCKELVSNKNYLIPGMIPIVELAEEKSFI
jgi:hypothetical protein